MTRTVTVNCSVLFLELVFCETNTADAPLLVGALRERPLLLGHRVEKKHSHDKTNTELYYLMWWVMWRDNPKGRKKPIFVQYDSR